MPTLYHRATLLPCPSLPDIHMLLILSLLAAPAHAENLCTSSSFLTEVSAKIAEAERQYPLMDQGEFASASKAVLETVECLEDTLDPKLAAAVHRIMGLRARVVDRDPNKARLSFATARRIDPNYAFPEEMIGPKDREITDYTAVPTTSAAFEDLRPPVKGDISMDGKGGDKRLVNWPTILQLRNAKGMVLETHYLWPEHRTPYYEAIPEGKLEVDQLIMDRILPAITAGTSAAAIGAGGAMMTVGLWDKTHVCEINEDVNCTKGAKQRTIIGASLAVAGLAGFGLTAGILAVKVDGQGGQVQFSGRW
jgi:hypothetical protein